MFAWSQFDVHYHGKEAHASAFPELGINALDALTVAQTAIGLLRQHIRPTDRVHGIITQGRRRRQRRARRTHRPLHGARRDPRRPRRDPDQGASLLRSRRARHRSDARYAARRPPYAEVAHDAEIAASIAATPRPSDALPRSRRRRASASGSTDMGNVSLGDARDPPVDRARLLSRRQPPAGVHGALRHASRGPGADRRRAGDGVDGDRSRDRAGDPRSTDSEAGWVKPDRTETERPDRTTRVH